MGQSIENRQLVSIIIPMYNEVPNLKTLREELCRVIDKLPYQFEIICVNDGSLDNTLSDLLALRNEDLRFKIIDLSRNFGKEAALTAGIEFAKGDTVIPFDADLQDPPEYIPQLLQKWKEGYDVVNAVRHCREGESRLKRITAYCFYRFINRLSEVEIPKDTGDFRLLSRQAVNALLKLPERRRFMKGLFSWVGFQVTSISYERAPRHAGKTSWNYWKLWNFALEGITSFSQAPLKLATYLGLIIASLSFIFGSYIIIKTLVNGNPVAGYPSLMVTVLFLCGVQLISIGIIGEYIGRIYDEVKQRPIYLIRRTWS